MVGSKYQKCTLACHAYLSGNVHNLGKNWPFSKANSLAFPDFGRTWPPKINQSLSLPMSLLLSLLLSSLFLYPIKRGNTRGLRGTARVVTWSERSEWSGCSFSLNDIHSKNIQFAFSIVEDMDKDESKAKPLPTVWTKMNHTITKRTSDLIRPTGCRGRDENAHSERWMDGSVRFMQNLWFGSFF